MSHPSTPPRPRSIVSHLALAVVIVAGSVIVTAARSDSPEKTDAGPRPVAVWPPGPLEVIAAFERPVAPSAVRSMVGRTIAYDEPRDGRPGAPAPSGPIGHLRIVGARSLDDGRTLVLATDPHPRPARYLLPPPDEARGSGPGAAPSAAVPYDLSGLEAAWFEGDPPAAEPKWTGWWPSLDLDATRRLTRGSRRHEEGLALLTRTGRLTLNGWVHLPPGRALLRFQSTGPIEEILLGDAQAAGPGAESGGLFRSDLTVESRGEPLFLTATIRTGGPRKPFHVKAAYRMADGTADRPLDRDRLLLPWTPPPAVAAIAAPIAVPDLSGGDPDRGRTIFRGDQARCAHCHAFRGEGGKVGPDLTEIARKGRAEIYRSIAAPSAAVEPDYTTYTVATRDGQVLAGVVRANGPDAIDVTDTNARMVTVRRDQVQEIRPSATSIMPPGLAAALGGSAVRDLIAYLTAPGPPANPSPR